MTGFRVVQCTDSSHGVRWHRTSSAAAAACARAARVRPREFIRLPPLTVGGPARGALTPEDTAVHEAGHAVAALLLPLHADPDSIESGRTGETAGRTHYRSSDTDVADPGEWLVQHLTVLQAGRAAEDLLHGSGRSLGHGGDDDESRDLVRRGRSAGFPLPPGSDGDVIGAAYGRARRLLEERRDLLDLVAGAVLEHGGLDSGQLRALLGGEQQG